MIEFDLIEIEMEAVFLYMFEKIFPSIELKTLNTPDDIESII